MLDSLWPGPYCLGWGNNAMLCSIPLLNVKCLWPKRLYHRRLNCLSEWVFHIGNGTYKSKMCKEHYRSVSSYYFDSTVYSKRDCAFFNPFTIIAFFFPCWEPYLLPFLVKKTMSQSIHRLLSLIFIWWPIFIFMMSEIVEATTWAVAIRKIIVLVHSAHVSAKNDDGHAEEIAYAVLRLW